MYAIARLPLGCASHRSLEALTRPYDLTSTRPLELTSAYQVA